MTTLAPSARGFLIRLAAEGIAPLVGGCAGAVLGGPAGAVAGGVLGRVAEEAVKYFGPSIVHSWLGWLQRQPPALQAAAVEQIGNLTPGEARQAAEQALAEVAPNASAADRAVALEYLVAIPAAVRRSLVTNRGRAGLSVPATLALASPRHLLGLLPTAVPPYQPGSDLPGTPYRLTELIGSGGFGAVYRATSPTLQHLTFAIKFCLDPSLLDALRRERALLDRLQSAHSGTGAERIVRLYGYDFDHRTPYLVYEFVPGSDLSVQLSRLDGKGLPAAEARALVVQLAEALAFAHERGLVHRDLKPANILLKGKDEGRRANEEKESEEGRNTKIEGAIKLTDFGIGSVTAAHSTQTRIGTTPLEKLDPAEQATLFRGAGTALYMSPEQRRGEPADPRHDLYSLGVIWYQMLVGDVSRELHPGWADELLEDHETPAEDVNVIRVCVGVMKKRPENAGKLLAMLNAPPSAIARVGSGSIEVPKREIAAPKGSEAQALREELVEAILDAEGEYSRGWRWGLWLFGVLSGSIGLGLFVLFFTLLTVARSEPTGPLRGGSTTFLVFTCIGFSVGVTGSILATVTYRSLNASRRRASARLGDVVASVQKRLGLPVLSCADTEHLARQVGWDLVRELEQHLLPRDIPARIRFTGSGFFNRSIKVSLDGYLLGEGGTRRGFDLPARLCRGTHRVELQVQRQNLEVWKGTFVIVRPGEVEVQIGPLVGMGLKVNVVGAHRLADEGGK